MSDKDKRKGEKPVPDNVEDLLNEDQMLTLRQIERFGWQLKFVRRPVFQQVIAVVVSSDGTQIGVLEDDGRLNLNHDVKLR
jgi:hypothetical protein